jgi:sulfopyruvate decarboxylase subunit alpha
MTDQPSQPSPSKRILTELKSEGFRLFCTLPDIWTTEIIELLRADPEVIHVPLAREEEGIGICVGASLAGTPSAMIIQNAGFFNCIGTIASLPLRYDVPFLLLISYRGLWGEDMPYHVHKGRYTEPLLNALGLSYKLVTTPDEAIAAIPDVWRLAQFSQRPVAMVLTREALGA